MDDSEGLKQWAKMTEDDRQRSPVERWVRGRRLYFRSPEINAKVYIKGEGHAELIELLVRWGYISCSYWQYHYPKIFKLKAA